MVIEELLQLLVGEVDAELLETVELFESKKQACVCHILSCFFLRTLFLRLLGAFASSLVLFRRILYAHLYIVRVLEVSLEARSSNKII